MYAMSQLEDRTKPSKKTAKHEPASPASSTDDVDGGSPQVISEKDLFPEEDDEVSFSVICLEVAIGTSKGSFKIEVFV